MRIRHLMAGLVLVMTPWQAVYAGDIVTWVDADGVTHFGNRLLAPVDAEAVDVAPANGMAVPEAPPSTSANRGPMTVVLEKQPNRTLRGWRGHQWNVNRRPARHHAR